MLAFFSAALWGIWWIPIRYLETLGLNGAWGSVVMNAGAALAALIWIVLSRARLRLGRRGAIGAVLVATATTTYSVAITMADVVLVILLFYLAPAWSKIIEWAFLNQPWRWPSSVAVVASLSGAYLVLGGSVSLATLGFGVVLALSSGVAWSVGAAFIFAGERSNPMSLSLLTALAATVIGLLFIWADPATGWPGAHTAAGMAGGMAGGAIYVLPILALTLWSAQRLSPAVISFLLTAEILSGVITGVLLLDEPFGMMQAAGTVLILCGAAVEVVPVFLGRTVKGSQG